MPAVTRSLLPYSPGLQPRQTVVLDARASDGPATVTTALGRTTKTPVNRPQIGLVVLRPNPHWNPGQN